MSDCSAMGCLTRLLCPWDSASSVSLFLLCKQVRLYHFLKIFIRLSISFFILQPSRICWCKWKNWSGYLVSRLLESQNFYCLFIVIATVIMCKHSLFYNDGKDVTLGKYASFSCRLSKVLERGGKTTESKNQGHQGDTKD